MDPMVVINQGLVAGMDIVGPRFKNCEMFIPEVLQSAASMHAGNGFAQAHLKGKVMEAKGVVCVGDGRRRPSRHWEESGVHDVGSGRILR